MSDAPLITKWPSGTTELKIDGTGGSLSQITQQPTRTTELKRDGTGQASANADAWGLTVDCAVAYFLGDERLTPYNTPTVCL